MISVTVVTALYLAIIEGDNIEMVRALIRAGADMDSPNILGDTDTPLQ